MSASFHCLSSGSTEKKYLVGSNDKRCRELGEYPYPLSVADRADRLVRAAAVEKIAIEHFENLIFLQDFVIPEFHCIHAGILIVVIREK